MLNRSLTVPEGATVLVRAVVSRGGRPDLAGEALPRVQAPTLLIVGGEDDVVIDLNQRALAQMHCEAKLEIVPGATHLFEEPGMLDQPGKTFVRDYMSADLVYCFEDQSIQEAERLMQEKQIRRLPVLTREKQLAGIVSLGDLATKTDEPRAVGKTLEKVSEPTGEASPTILL